jgi:hypothetical protein
MRRPLLHVCAFDAYQQGLERTKGHVNVSEVCVPT